MSDQKRLTPPGAFLLAAIAGLSFFVRTSFWRNFVRPGGGFLFYSVDAHDHLRRVTLGTRTFPHVPVFDSYAGFPKGTGQIWSPVYDWVLSAVALAAGATRSAIEVVCFLANPVFALLSILLLFAFARRLLGSAPAALAAALLLAMSPGHISYTHPMNFDHHVLEPVAVMLLLSLAFLEEGDRLSLAGQFAATIALVAALFLWRGSTLYWGLTLLRVLVWTYARRSWGLCRDYSWSFAGAAALLGCFVAYDPWGGARDISFAVISLFHVILLAGAALVLVAAGPVSRRRLAVLAVGSSALACFVVLGLPALRQAGRALLAGATFFGRSADPWLASNSELKGTFQEREFLPAATYLTVFWFLAPAAVLHASVRWWRKERDSGALFTFCWIAPLLAMGLVRRYAHVAGLAAALAGAYLFALAWRRWQRPAARGAATAVLLALLLPSLPHYRDTFASSLPDDIRLGLVGPHGALTWLREKTPRTSHLLDPQEVPEYGVMAEWDLGARIYQLAERPAVATAFGWETHGFYEENAFMASTRPEVAASILEENRVRYVLLRALQNRASHFAIARYGATQGRLSSARVTPYSPEEAIYARLMYNDGRAYRFGSAIVPAVGRLRLVYESAYLAADDSHGGLSYYKIFEFVAGASVRGSASPGDDVVISVALRTARGRAFRWVDGTRAGSDGTFTFVVPYATGTSEGDTLVEGKYVLSDASGRTADLAVSEEDVTTGRALTVTLARR